MILLITASGAAYSTYLWLDRTPGELLRYIERRASGHPKVEWFSTPLIHWARDRVERPVYGLYPPARWRGGRAGPVARDAPLPSSPATAEAASANGNIKVVGSIPELIKAIGSAGPGDVIEILPGRYRASGPPISTRAGGLPSAPITVRARNLGEVILEFNMLEGFSVTHPFWVFENLEIVGVCRHHSSCEHAFHIVGAAHSVRIQNNRLRDFNAQIKVNGLNNRYPDSGVIESNAIFNTKPRITENPVTPVDIVAANGWRVSDNLIADFVKAGGNGLSYGVFIKGGGSGGRIERNVIICALTLQKQRGLRVGLSFGGGGSGAAYCRNRRCDFEHEEGLAANNIVAHCNDFGIDVHRSKGIVIAHNTLINTAGIDIRDFPASAAISNNVIEGRIRGRRGGWFAEANNWFGSPHAVFEDPDQLEFKWIRRPDEVPSLPLVTHDICGAERGSMTLPGATAEDGACLRTGSS